MFGCDSNKVHNLITRTSTVIGGSWTKSVVDAVVEKQYSS